MTNQYENNIPGFKPAAEHFFNTLVIIFHGYVINPLKYRSLTATVFEVYKDAKVLLPKMPLSVFSCADPNKIVNDILCQVDAVWNSLNLENQQSLKIILIGHSTGALLARKFYVAACGENDDAPLEAEINGKAPRAWANNVDRVILFAGINRGWTINPHMPLNKAIVLGLGIFIGKIMSLFKFYPIAFKTRKGSKFITQLRIQSLSMLKKIKEKGIGNALTIQLLGTKDDLVSPEDNIDLLTGSKFVYLEVPYSNHINVIDMTGTAGSKRETVVRMALKETETILRESEVVTSDIATVQQNEKITDVVFVIHGIRDTGYWTQKIARKVKQLGEKIEGKKFATETSSYGYFPMLSFLLFPFRRAKVEWLMDQYIENSALYPKAKFSFIGHSNGTYLLAKALTDYPACRFENIVLAGSVVHSRYNWHSLIQQKRIKSIYNFVATDDWVVGIFPKTFQTLRLQDLGSGGYDGFECLDDKTQFKCIEGGHSAAIEEHVWDEIAHIAIHGTPSRKGPLVRKERSFIMKLLGIFSPLIFLVGFFLLVVGGPLLIWKLVSDEYLRTIFIACYVLLIYKVLTWF